MEDDPNARGVSDTDQTESDGVDDQETQDQGAEHHGKSVSHSTYRKLVAEAKKERTARRQAEERLKALDDERLEASGQKDDLIKSLRGKLDAESKRAKEVLNSFAKKSLNAQLKGAALEAGCIDPDAVMNLADLSEIEVSTDTFEADAGEIKTVINDLKKSKPYLFQKSAPKVNARLPGGDRHVPGGVDFSQMTRAEVEKFLRDN